MDQPLISIIVPVYKVEPYLRKCVDSILAQTYTNIEVILIDDGSPDGCPAICDEYAEKDSRVVVIHQENAGVSAARNAGLEIAKGDCIGFVDSDDWIEPDMYEVLLAMLLEHNSRIACIACCYETGSSNTVVSHSWKISILNNIDAITMMYDRKIEKGVCFKLFSRELFKNAHFPVGVTNGEDFLVSVELFCHVTEVTFVEYPAYHYLQRKGSATKIIGSSYITVLKAYDSVNKCLAAKAPIVLPRAKTEMISRGIIIGVSYADNKMLSKEQYKNIRDHIISNCSKESLGILSKKNRILLAAFLTGRVPFLILRWAYNKLRGR